MAAGIYIAWVLSIMAVGAVGRDFVCAAGFVEPSHFYRPKDLPRDQHPWLPSV